MTAPPPASARPVRTPRFPASSPRALSQSFDFHWQLEAVTGATSASALDRLQRLTPADFDIAVVVLGVNDVTGAVPLSRWLARRHAIGDILKSRFHIKHIIHSGLPPMGHFPLLPHPLRWTLGRTATRFDAALGRFLRHRARSHPPPA